MLSRRTLLLKPMQTAANGYARVQTEGAHSLVQLHARGLEEGEVRLFAQSAGHAVKETARGQVNAHGEASLECEVPVDTEALILMGMPPKPLLIGLCRDQDGGSVLDVKNTALALAQRLRPRKQEEPKEAEPPVEQPAEKPHREPPLPREIFLPAIDPAPYMQAAQQEQTEEAILPPPRPQGPPVDRLRALEWPRGFETLEKYFESGMPRALFALPQWRFVQAANGLYIGRRVQDGRVKGIAYAYEGDHPPEKQGRYQRRHGLDGHVYQVLWMKV